MNSKNNILPHLRDHLCGATDNVHHLTSRFLAEIDFALDLGKLHPRRRKRWHSLITQAQAMVERAVIADKPELLPGAFRTAEEVLAPIGAIAKQYTLHCIGHSHIDMNWMWSWPETVALTRDTFKTVLKLMDEFSDFCFTQSQASVYAIVCEYSPELLDQIKKHVKEGRWEIAATQWVEGDKNLASGESLARHLLYTRCFLGEHFGLDPEDILIGWEPDTFGHAVTIPSILSRGGVTRYYLCRGGDDEKPPVFW